ncbi:MAG: hypothetical protein ACREO9_07345, partial [Lysobacterales bacterium]
MQRTLTEEQPVRCFRFRAGVGYHALSASHAVHPMTEAATAESPESFPAERSEFFLRGPAGRLECAADVPKPAEQHPVTIVICHPHPQHGGTMRNKVVTIIERSM